MQTGLCSQLQQGTNGDIIEHELCQPGLVLEWQQMEWFTYYDLTSYFILKV